MAVPGTPAGTGGAGGGGAGSSNWDSRLLQVQPTQVLVGAGLRLLSPGSVGGAGGSGIVIIRYAV